MALNGSSLGSHITAELQAAGFLPKGDHTVNQPFWDAIGKAIVKHIQEDAEVPVTAGSSAGTYKVR
ncbi:MAG: hypothetical protein ACRDDI_13600 [Aeromonas veronii]